MKSPCPAELSSVLESPPLSSPPSKESENAIETSMTDTINERISEGQLMLSLHSEGEVPHPHIEEGIYWSISHICGSTHSSWSHYVFRLSFLLSYLIISHSSQVIMPHVIQYSWSCEGFFPGCYTGLSEWSVKSLAASLGLTPYCPAPTAHHDEDTLSFTNDHPDQV